MARSLFLSAAHKSSGKTTLAIGLSAAIGTRGFSVQTFKKGPDYIDPIWLSRTSGRACRNLDFFTMGRREIVGNFAQFGNASDIALVEGNKGLFDGLDTEGSDSSAALAKLLGTPVILVVDTYGITRGIAPLLLGLLNFDPDVKIAGVILNKVGGSRHQSKLRAAVERYTDLPILGAIGRRPDIEIEERHLGLMPANEMPEASEIISRIAAIIEADVDVDAVLACCEEPAPTLDVDFRPPPPNPAAGRADLRIGIARDAAFGFYYPDDLEALGRAGAELVPFDTLGDRHLPAVDGLYLGGGFPETHMRILAGNAGLKAEIRAAIEDGMPAYAECGGLLYLARSLSWRGEKYDMAGVVPGDAVIGDRPVGRGYVCLKETRDHPWIADAGGPADAEIRVHEFHYASLEGLPDDQTYAYKVTRGHGIDGRRDGLVINNLLACFAHHRDVENNRWARRFVAFVRRIKQARVVPL